MRSLPQAVSRALVSIAMLVGVWCILAAWAVHKTAIVQDEAEQFLLDVRKLHVGESTIDQVTPFMKKYRVGWVAADTPPSHPPSIFSTIFSLLIRP